ncbi:hypothetical protein JTB14_034277 [Gonioctena quinquepunctata]|nr:hypothetical protein JTB14_034277 [Gonioctena quinquepunctata]
MSIEELRISSRVTKGIPPIRLGNEESPKKKNKNGKRKGKEKQSITSKGTRTTSTSLVRRRNIQAELEAHRKLAEIAKKELEIEKNLIQKELELNRLAELDDIQKGVESVVLEDFSNIKENISEDTSRKRRVKYDEIQQWVDTAPSDDSFNCDFRYIEELSTSLKWYFFGDFLVKSYHISLVLVSILNQNKSAFVFSVLILLYLLTQVWCFYYHANGLLLEEEVEVPRQQQSEVEDLQNDGNLTETVYEISTAGSSGLQNTQAPSKKAYSMKFHNDLRSYAGQSRYFFKE